MGGSTDTEEKAASLAASGLISLVDVVTLSLSLLVKSSLLQEAKMKLRQFLFAVLLGHHFFFLLLRTKT